LKIVVCLKPVPDTSSAPRLDTATKRLVRAAGETIMNPFDEFALEAALRLRDAQPAHTVTVLALGPAGSKESLRKSLAMGADDAVHCCDDRFAGSDGTLTANILAAALRRIGYDLVLCGTQSADGGGGYLPTLLAGLLGLPAMTTLRSLHEDGDRLIGERSVDGERTRLSCDIPLLASISKESIPPRYASLKNIMAAKKKEIRVIDATELGCTEMIPMTEVLEFAAPPEKQRGRVINAQDAAVAAQEILRFLQERHVL
jgi:electron transfer flavoprotein beta subunit